MTRRAGARAYHRSPAGQPSRLVFGGPPECPTRPFCLVGLAKVYGLSFKAFVPLDAGGPLTVAALQSGKIGIGLLFTSDPSIVVDGFVLLTDDRHLQASDNLAPVVRSAVLKANGYTVVRTFDLGSREVVQPAIQAGQIDLYPEYLASLTEYLDKGTGLATTDPAQTSKILARLLAPKGESLLAYAPATDENGFAVTRQTAQRYGLVTLSDLAKPAP